MSYTSTSEVTNVGLLYRRDNTTSDRSGSDAALELSVPTLTTNVGASTNYSNNYSANGMINFKRTNRLISHELETAAGSSSGKQRLKD